MGCCLKVAALMVGSGPGRPVVGWPTCDTGPVTTFMLVEFILTKDLIFLNKEKWLPLLRKLNNGF